MEIKEIIEKVISEELEPLKGWVQIKAFEKWYEAKIEEVKILVVEAAEQYEKHFKVHGVGFEKRNGTTRYDYKAIQEWIDAKKKLTDIELKYKGAYIQSQKGIIGVSKEDGEVLQLPKVTQTNQVLIIKHQK